MIYKRAVAFYQKHTRWIPFAAFSAGFIFDMLTLRRIDRWTTIAQQSVYLAAATFLLYLELIELGTKIQPPTWLKKLWHHREFAFHFLLGALLNAYAIFYFKSASALSSFIYIALLGIMLVINEFARFQKGQTQIHVALVSLCLVSFLCSLAPILMGFIGIFPFAVSMMASLGLFGLFYAQVSTRLTRKQSRTHVLLPFALVQILFVGLYLARAIPPVPLSVAYLGIYHAAEKRDEGYYLSYSRSSWRFWEHGDQTFLARPGDVVIAYAQIFSPTRFREQLQVRWLLRHPTLGWQTQDTIPLTVTGGREDGFRTVTRKANYQPGKWRVQIETADDREVGRLGFTVIPDENTDEREYSTVVK